MKTFKSISDLEQLRDHPLHATIQSLFLSIINDYTAAQFEDAFARYLSDPEKLPQRCNDLPESNNGEAECVSDAENVAATSTTEETQEFTSLPGCGGVADISGDADSTCAPGMPSLSKPEDTF